MGKFLVFTALFWIFASTPSTADENHLNPNKNAGGQEELRIGIGAGIPYGILGFNLEARPIDYAGFSAGLGYAKGEPGWSFGARAYPLGKKYRLSPRLGVYYGTVSILENWDDSKDTQSGVSYGIGLDWRPERSARGSFDFDIIYIATDTRIGYVEGDGGGDVKFSLGYGYNF